MREEEAKIKWCPMVQVSGINERGINQTNRKCNGTFNEYSFCIASDCMMWVQTDNEGYPSNAKNNDPDNAVYFPAGYCGLARQE